MKKILVTLAIGILMIVQASASEGANLEELLDGIVSHSKQNNDCKAMGNSYINKYGDQLILNEKGELKSFMNEADIKGAKGPEYKTPLSVVEKLKDMGHIPEDYFPAYAYKANGLINIRLYKDLNDNIINFYNSIAITLYEDTNQVHSFDHFDWLVLEKGQVQPEITMEEALKKAQARQVRDGYSDIVREARLEVVEIEAYDDKSQADLIEDKYYLAYSFRFADKHLVMVDARTGNVIGQDLVESYHDPNVLDFVEKDPSLRAIELSRQPFLTGLTS